MKLQFSLLFLATVLKICSNVYGDDCMSPLQIIAATSSLCTMHRQNKALWQQVIDCHHPISEEVSSAKVYGFFFC